MAEGTELGRYQLEKQIGSGGVGQVWEARHVELGHLMAVKLLGAGGDSPVERQRFFQEAKLSARLGRECRHIVRVEDHGIAETADGGAQPYLVMELLKGETLGARLRREPALALAEIAALVEQLARALTFTHAAGIIHRDLKPSNIFLVADREEGVCAKLLDFGIAKDTTGDGLTRTGSVLGTPGYMSPEQVSGRDVDSRSDLWSLSAVVFRMLTRQAPFGSGSFEEVTARVLWQPAPQPSSLRPELPASVDRFITRGLARSPTDRFQSAADLSAAFSRCIDSAATDLGSAPEHWSLPAADALTQAGSDGFSIPTNRLRGYLATGLIAAALLAISFVTWRHFGAAASHVSQAHSASTNGPAKGTASQAPLASAAPTVAPRAETALVPRVAPTVELGASRRGEKGVRVVTSSRAPSARTPAGKRTWLNTDEM